MAVRRVRVGMRFAQRIEVPAGAHAVARAAVALLMQMKTVRAGRQAGHARFHMDLVALGRELDRAGHVVALGRFQRGQGRRCRAAGHGGAAGGCEHTYQ